MRRTVKVSSHRRSQLAARAREMRHQPTASEEAVWRLISGGKTGVVFRRQAVLLGKYIADFYAPELRLVVEVDGGWHEGRERADARRDGELREAGYRVVRVRVG